MAQIKTVRITDEDIANGKKFDNDLCPIGLAFQRDVGHPWDKRVLQVSKKDNDFVCDWARRFDSGATVGTFAFDVEVSDA